MVRKVLRCFIEGSISSLFGLVIYLIIKNTRVRKLSMSSVCVCAYYDYKNEFI